MTRRFWVRLCREIPEASKQPECYIKSCNAQFQFREVTENEVFNLLSNISTNKATGPDKIPAKLVKISAPFITKHLSIIFNQSLSQGTFPYDWKISKVTPIYKKGPKHDMNNYRPISVISTIAKVMDKIAHNQLYLYFQNENILSPSQHGFRQGHSTVTALLEITDRLYHNIDIGELNGVIFLDLRKAFDTIDHQIMLKKLRCYGIAGTAHNWFSSYLSNRSQYCQVDGNLSQPSSVLGGIPQGSILGPLLFLLYINDLPNCLSDTKCNMFADDTQLDRSSSDVNIVTNALNNDLKNVFDWLSTNKLSLNTEKTEYMIIGSHQRLRSIETEPAIYLGANKIKRESTKSLGLMLDETLSWNQQINALSNKVNKSLNVIKRLREIVDLETLLIAYKTLVQPYFEYCSQAWGGLGSTLSDKLQRLQNRAVRIITKCGYDVRSHILLQNLNLKNLEIRRNQQLVTLMFKVRNAMAPSSISNLFQRVDDAYNRQTRQMHFNYLPPKPNTNFKKKSISYRGAVAWNSLPCDLKKPQSIESFKNKLRLITM